MVGPELEKRRAAGEKESDYQGDGLLQPTLLRMRIQQKVRSCCCNIYICNVSLQLVPTTAYNKYLYRL